VQPPITNDNFDERAWAELLSTELGSRVCVRFGRAKSSVLRAVRAEGALTVHMSSFFSRAPDPVRHLVVRWLKVGRRAPRTHGELDRWIDSELERIHRDTPVMTRSTRPRGAVHDLDRIADSLFASEFARDFAPDKRPAMTWGRFGHGRRSLRLGSFDPYHRLVRVHPALDQEAVPEWFVRYIVFHELLHAAIPRERSPQGIRIFHGPRFRAREEIYRDYRRALDWERANIERLIRSARKKQPMRVSSRASRGAARSQAMLFPD
jgi:hypothetical protein